MNSKWVKDLCQNFTNIYERLHFLFMICILFFFEWISFEEHLWKGKLSTKWEFLLKCTVVQQIWVNNSHFSQFLEKRAHFHRFLAVFILHHDKRESVKRWRKINLIKTSSLTNNSYLSQYLPPNYHKKLCLFIEKTPKWLNLGIVHTLRPKEWNRIKN